MTVTEGGTIGASSKIEQSELFCLLILLLLIIGPCVISHGYTSTTITSSNTTIVVCSRYMIGC
jgi:hypothetical protein